jgi:hypothetical protein
MTQRMPKSMKTPSRMADFVKQNFFNVFQSKVVDKQFKSRYLGCMNTTQSVSMDDGRMSRIKRVSKILRLIMLVGLIFEGAGLVAEVITIPINLLHLSAFKSQTLFSNCQAFINLSLGYLVTLNFFRLFSRLKDGHLFEGQTIGYLEQAGKWWIVFGIVGIIYQSIGAYLLSPNKINISDGGAIFSGLIVFFVAWVLREGQKLKEEQELTV